MCMLGKSIDLWGFIYEVNWRGGGREGGGGRGGGDVGGCVGI